MLELNWLTVCISSYFNNSCSRESKNNFLLYLLYPLVKSQIVLSVSHPAYINNIISFVLRAIDSRLPHNSHYMLLSHIFCQAMRELVVLPCPCLLKRVMPKHKVHKRGPHALGPHNDTKHDFVYLNPWRK